MKIAFNPSTVAALTTPPNNKDITFDLRGRNIFARGVKFCGTDTNTWRDIKINNVSIGSHTLDLRNGSNTTLTNTNGVVTINSTWRPVVDNLTSNSTTSSLSANQGRVLAGLINGKSDSDHNHDGRYVKKSGDTMLGALNFANGTWNLVGDDSYMGDCNVSGHVGIKAANTTYPGITFFNNASTYLGNLTAYSGNIKYGAYSLQFLDNGNTSVRVSTWTNPFSAYNSNAIADGQAICVWGQASQLSNLSTDTGDMSLWLKRVNAKVATLNMVLDGEYYAGGNQRLAHVSEIPTSLKNPYALTISLNGTSQGPYDGSAAKNINITPGSIGAATSGHNHDDRYLKLTGGTMLLGEGLKFHSNDNYFGTNADARIISLLDNNDKICDGGLIIDERATLNGKEYVTELLRIRDSEFKWRGADILHSGNYSGILDSRYYTESEVNNLLSKKLDRVNLSTGNWNPRGYHLAADYNYNGGDLSISESGGQIHVSVDGYFWQNEGKYRVLDTSDVAGLKNDLTVHQYLSNTDTTWWPLIWGGSSHNNASDSTGAVYKSHDVLSWQTSSQTLYATNIQTENIKHLSIGGGIYWNPNVESASDGSDAASITLVKAGVAGGTTLVLSQMNDTNDTIQFQTNTAARLYHNSYPILTTQNTYVSNNKGYINGTEITQVNNSDTLDNWHKDNIQWTGYITSSNSLSSYWFKMYQITVTGYQYNDITITFLVSEGYSKHFSIFHLKIRQHGTNHSGNYNLGVELRELVGNLRDRVVAYYNNSTGDVQLWGNPNGQYNTMNYTVLKKTTRIATDSSSLGILTAQSFSSVQTPPSTGYTRVTMARVGSVSYSDSTGSVHWNNVTNKPSTFNPAAHTHTVFKNNLMIKGTNGISDGASIHLGIGDSDTGFKWISDGVCQIYANYAAVGQWTSGGMNWFKNPTVNGNKVWNAGNDGSGSGLDADTVDGYHATDGRTFNGDIHWGSWNDTWSDGTHTHPWYGFDHRYPNTGTNSTTISDYYGMTIKTYNTLLLDCGTLLLNSRNNVGIGTTSPTQKLDVHGNIRATGQIIREGSSQIWVYGRNAALLRETSVAGYHTLWSLKTTDGSWDFGEFNINSDWNNIPVLSYVTDSNYNSGNNVTTYQIKFPLASGTVALTSNIPNPTNYYWANVKISTSSSTTTSPTVHTLTATRVCAGHDPGIANSISCSNWFRSSGNTGWYNTTYRGGWYMSDTSWIRAHNGVGIYTGGQIYSDSSIRMGSIRLERTNEINSSDNLLINYGSSTNVSLCQGGGNVGIGILTPTQKLDVRGNIITKGFGIQPYYLSRSILPTINPGDGYTYKCLEIDGTTEISCIIADRAGLMNERGILIKFNKGYDGQIILLKDLQNYGGGNGYFWVMPSGCKIIKADGSSILIGQNQISNTYDDGHSRFLVYSSVYSVWIEFLCS